MENNWQGFSSINKNSEASYQCWSIKIRKWLETVIQYHIGWESYVFDYYELIQYKWNYIRN